MINGGGNWRRGDTWLCKGLDGAFFEWVMLKEDQHPEAYRALLFSFVFLLCIFFNRCFPGSCAQLHSLYLCNFIVSGFCIL